MAQKDPFSALEEAAGRQRAEEEALRALTQARCKLVLGKDARSAFFATLALRLIPEVSWSTDTLSTDGKKLFFNPAFVQSLAPEELLGVVAHEVMHNALQHHCRRGHREHNLWNTASDLAVNPLLLEAGFTLPASRLLPGEGEHGHLPVGKSAEEYYDLLLNPDPGSAQGQPQGGDGQGSQPQQQSGQDEDQDEDQDDPENQEQESEDPEESGDAPQQDDQDDQNQDGPVDDPKDQDQEESQEGGTAPQQDRQGNQNQDGPGQQGKQDSDPGRCGSVRDPGHGSPAEARQSEAEWQVAVAQAHQTARQRGELPGGLARMVEEVLQAKVDWREVLRHFLSQQARNDFSWSHPNRRFLHQGLYLPGLRSEELGEVVLAVDTSGSIGESELSRFAAEVQAILESFEVSLTILYHDAEVLRVQQWRSADGPLTLEPIGGGGTSHVCVFEHLETLDEQPVCVICLTDLYTGFPSIPPAIPTLWAVVGGNKSQPPFGMRVDLDP